MQNTKRVGTLGGYMHVTDYKGLTCCSEYESCNEIHSQLQTIGKVPTVFAFCISPSLTLTFGTRQRHS